MDNKVPIHRSPPGTTSSSRSKDLMKATISFVSDNNGSNTSAINKNNSKEFKK